MSAEAPRATVGLLGALLALVLIAAAGSATAQTGAARIVPSDRPDQSRPARGPQPDLPAPDRVARPRAAVQPFVLRTVEVAGASLPQAELAAAWRPFVGQTFDAAGLQKITDAIAAGYAKSDIAIYTIAVEPQDFAAGVVRVRVVEGYVEGVDVAEAAAAARPLVDSYARRLGAERPLRRSTLERYVSLIRDIPGLQAEVDMRTGAAPGAVRLRVTGKLQRFQGALTVNNRGTAFLGRTQAQADLFLNSLFRAGDQTRATYATPTEPRLFQFYALQHTQALGADGLTASASVSHLKTRPKGTDLVGRATAAGLQLTYPVQRSFDQDVYLTLGLDGVDNENAFLGFTFADDRTRALRLSGAFSRRSERRLTYGSLSLSHGLDVLGARRTDSRLSTLGFWKTNGRAGASFALGRNAALRLNGAAQWSPDRLPATEQFALGGDEFGRAFEASIIAGDYGAAGAAELAFAPDLAAPWSGSEAYGFVDAGKVWYRARFGNPALHANLASAGLGVRAKVADRVLVEVEAARALEDPDPAHSRGDWRGVFLVKAVF